MPDPTPDSAADETRRAAYRRAESVPRPAKELSSFTSSGSGIASDLYQHGQWQRIIGTQTAVRLFQGIDGAAEDPRRQGALVEPCSV